MPGMSTEPTSSCAVLGHMKTTTRHPVTKISFVRSLEFATNPQQQSKTPTKSTTTTMSEDETKGPTEMIPVTWSGKKLFIEKSKLDEWYDNSFESRKFYAEEHPWAVQGSVFKIHDFDQERKDKEEKKADEEVDMSKFVVVHWSSKSLLLRREQLDTWYSESPEDRCEFVKTHPEAVIDFSE